MARAGAAWVPRSKFHHGLLREAKASGIENIHSIPRDERSSGDDGTSMINERKSKKRLVLLSAVLNQLCCSAGWERAKEKKVKSFNEGYKKF
jgi:hypothetical protein